MKKVLFAISLVILGSTATVTSKAEIDENTTQNQNISDEGKTIQIIQASKQKTSPTKTAPNFTLNFNNINELSQSNLLSEQLKNLLTSCLKVIRGLVNNNEAEGNTRDLQSAEGYLAQYKTIESRLKNTESAEKIYNIPELDIAGRNEIEENKKIVESLPQANSLQKVMELPNLNKNTVERLKAYNGILASIENVKELPDVYKIPGISPEFIEESKKSAALFEEMKNIDSIERLKKFPIANTELIEEIQKLEQLDTYIREHTDTIEETKKIPGLSEKTIVAISRLEKENEALKEENAKLNKNLEELSKNFTNAAQSTRNEYYFRMIVISLLERALFGFEFALADSFESLSSDYEHSVVAHATKLLPWSAGLEKEMWCRVTEIIGSMLQLALSVDNISDHISLLEKNVDRALSNLKKCDDEKTRFVIEALERLSSSLQNYKRHKNAAKFDDFNERKKAILEKIEKLNNEHIVERMNSEQSKAMNTNKPEAKDAKDTPKPQDKPNVTKNASKSQDKSDATKDAPKLQNKPNVAKDAPRSQDKSNTANDAPKSQDKSNTAKDAPKSQDKPNAAKGAPKSQDKSGAVKTNSKDTKAEEKKPESK